MSQVDIDESLQNLSNKEEETKSNGLETPREDENTPSFQNNIKILSSHWEQQYPEKKALIFRTAKGLSAEDKTRGKNIVQSVLQEADNKEIFSTLSEKELKYLLSHSEKPPKNLDELEAWTRRFCDNYKPYNKHVEFIIGRSKDKDRENAVDFLLKTDDKGVLLKLPIAAVERKLPSSKDQDVNIEALYEERIKDYENYEKNVTFLKNRYTKNKTKKGKTEIEATISKILEEEDREKILIEFTANEFQKLLPSRENEPYKIQDCVKEIIKDCRVEYGEKQTNKYLKENFTKSLNKNSEGTDSRRDSKNPQSGKENSKTLQIQDYLEKERAKRKRNSDEDKKSDKGQVTLKKQSAKKKQTSRKKTNKYISKIGKSEISKAELKVLLENFRKPFEEDENKWIKDFYKYFENYKWVKEYCKNAFRKGVEDGMINVNDPLSFSNEEEVISNLITSIEKGNIVLNFRKKRLQKNLKKGIYDLLKTPEEKQIREIASEISPKELEGLLNTFRKPYQKEDLSTWIEGFHEHFEKYKLVKESCIKGFMLGVTGGGTNSYLPVSPTNTKKITSNLIQKIKTDPNILLSTTKEHLKSYLEKNIRSFLKTKKEKYKKEGDQNTYRYPSGDEKMTDTEERINDFSSAALNQNLEKIKAYLNQKNSTQNEDKENSTQDQDIIKQLQKLDKKNNILSKLSEKDFELLKDDKNVLTQNLEQAKGNVEIFYNLCLQYWKIKTYCIGHYKAGAKSKSEDFEEKISTAAANVLKENGVLENPSDLDIDYEYFRPIQNTEKPTHIQNSEEAYVQWFYHAAKAELGNHSIYKKNILQITNNCDGEGMGGPEILGKLLQIDPEIIQLLDKNFIASLKDEPIQSILKNFRWFMSEYKTENEKYKKNIIKITKDCKGNEERFIIKELFEIDRETIESLDEKLIGDLQDNDTYTKFIFVQFFKRKFVENKKFEYWHPRFGDYKSTIETKLKENTIAIEDISHFSETLRLNWTALHDSKKIAYIREEGKAVEFFVDQIAEYVRNNKEKPSLKTAEETPSKEEEACSLETEPAPSEPQQEEEQQETGTKPLQKEKTGQQVKVEAPSKSEEADPPEVATTPEEKKKTNPEAKISESRTTVPPKRTAPILKQKRTSWRPEEKSRRPKELKDVIEELNTENLGEFKEVQNSPSWKIAESALKNQYREFNNTTLIDPKNNGTNIKEHTKLQMLSYMMDMNPNDNDLETLFKQQMKKVSPAPSGRKP